MEHHRYAVYSVNDPQSWRLLEPNKYSAFKYGCAYSTIFLANKMAGLLERHIDPTQSWFITSAAYKAVPTAATNLLSCLLRTLTYHNTFTPFVIRRRQIYAQDFASLRPADRFELIHKVGLETDHELIKGQRVIVIDDAYVSGAHEENILKLFNDQPSEAHFFYLADLSGLNQLTTEEKLNQAAVHSLEDLSGIISTGNFLLNARILKFLLGYPNATELCSFLEALDSTHLNDIYLGATKDGYDALPAFQRNFSLLRQKYYSPLKLVNSQ